VNNERGLDIVLSIVLVGPNYHLPTTPHYWSLQVEKRRKANDYLSILYDTDKKTR
jgi:hypothetical protein